MLKILKSQNLNQLEVSNHFLIILNRLSALKTKENSKTKLRFNKNRFHHFTFQRSFLTYQQ